MQVRVHVLFARDLLINMAPWLLACVLATALQAKCLQVRKGNCKWRCAAAAAQFRRAQFSAARNYLTVFSARPGTRRRSSSSSSAS